MFYKIDFGVLKGQKSFTKTKIQFIKLNDFFGIIHHWVKAH
jgi:hypothetical protein